MKNTKNQMKGFSLLECLIVVAVVGILGTMAIANTSGGLQNAQAESAVSSVVGQLRVARMVAIAQRRNVVVTIDTTQSGPDNVQHVNYQVVPANGEPEQPMESVQLPGGMQFLLEAGVPDTPMQFGNSAAVSFSGDGTQTSSVMQFTPTGAFTDGNNNVLNGTIFLGMPDTPTTARAVTVFGGVGDVQRFTWTGSEWDK